MNRRSILTKTGKGLMEVTGKTSALSRDLRNILKEIDGKVSVSELLRTFSKMTEPELLEAGRGRKTSGPGAGNRSPGSGYARARRSRGEGEGRGGGAGKSRGRPQCKAFGAGRAFGACRPQSRHPGESASGSTRPGAARGRRAAAQGRRREGAPRSGYASGHRGGAVR